MQAWSPASCSQGSKMTSAATCVLDWLEEAFAVLATAKEILRRNAIKSEFCG